MPARFAARLSRRRMRAGRVISFPMLCFLLLTEGLRWRRRSDNRVDTGVGHRHMELLNKLVASFERF